MDKKLILTIDYENFKITINYGNNIREVVCRTKESFIEEIRRTLIDLKNYHNIH